MRRQAKRQPPAVGAPTDPFENASVHPGGYEDRATTVILPTGGTSRSVTNLMIDPLELGMLIASLHDCEAVEPSDCAKLTTGAQDILANSETREEYPSVISLALESFSIVSGFLLQDDPEQGGEGHHSQVAPALIPESV
jgi:hypothetical protein